MSDHSYWLKQTDDVPLFPDVLWSRPESKTGAGKLAIIGGNAHGFGAPGIAYNTALHSGVGVCKVLMPDAVKKTVKHLLPDADFAPSTPSGSFARKSLSELLSIGHWADAVLLAGDIGRNSETAVLLEEFVQKHNGLLCITQDAADYFKKTPRLLLERTDTLLIVSLAQLQKLFINVPLMIPITYSMSVMQLAEALHELTETFPASVVVKHHETLFVAASGQVASQIDTRAVWRVETAARTTVFWLQQPEKQFEAVVSSMINQEAE